jgi:tRNA (cytosine38-C5)-methyltransferase
VQAKQESLCFHDPSVNNKLLRTPACLTLNSATTQNSYKSNEDVLEVVCKPIRDFLQAQIMDTVDQDCSDTISDSKFKPAICINCQDVSLKHFHEYSF